MPDPKPTIVEALAQVMGEVQSVGKTGRNTQQNYSFRGIDAVVNAVGPAMRLYGVVCVPTTAEHRIEHYTTKSGTEMKNVTVLVGFRFYGPAGDYIDTFASGEAADSGDKATPKAHSVAYRTMLLQALCIPTDEPDPDQDSHERGTRPEIRQNANAVPRPTSWPKVKDAMRACDNPDEAEALYEAFLRAATYHLYGKTSLKEITADERKVMLQKAAGAAVWLAEHEDETTDGPFHFYLEPTMRQAWAAMLDGTLLEIPDYQPPEPPLPEKTQEDVDAIAAEVFADPS